MSKLIETLAAELERPRDVSAQVARYLGRTYDVEHDNIGPFLVNELSRLEDDDIDLILSPLFTPKLADQAVIAQLLGAESVSRDRWSDLIQQLVSRPTVAQLVTSDGRSHAVALREVTVERWVHRLRLDGAISAALMDLIGRAPSADGPILKAVARRAIWDSDKRAGILTHYFTAALERGVYQRNDAIELLNLVESYKPADAADLASMIPHWQQVLRHEIDTASGPKPFFNQRAEELHGGDRDQRQHDHARLSVKENELAFLDRLQQILAA